MIIDISEWQKGLDFTRLRGEGVEGIIIRLSYGTREDYCFQDFYNQAKANGFPVGAYVYGLDTSTQSAIATANWVRDKLRGKQFELPIFYDTEDNVQKALSPRALTDVIKAFCSTLESNNFWVGIYASESFFNSNVIDSELTRYSHWVAKWSTHKPVLNSGAEIQMWQFGGETNYLRSNQIAGRTIDQDYKYVDYESLIKANKLNGFGDTQSNTNSIQVGSTVRVNNAISYEGQPFKVWYATYTVMELKGQRAVIGVNGVITSSINVNNLSLA